MTTYDMSPLGLPDTPHADAVICDPWDRAAYPAARYDAYWSGLRKHSQSPATLAFTVMHQRWPHPFFHTRRPRYSTAKGVGDGNHDRERHGQELERQSAVQLSEAQRSKLRLAIMYSRQITGDALELLRQYERKRIVKDAGEAQMARDYFGRQKAAKEALERYFGLDLKQAADRAKVGGIIQKFKLTDAGLSGAFEIVVGGIHDAADVKEGVKDALSSLKRGRVKSAWRRIKFIRTGTDGWVANGGKHTRGRIHLNIDVIDEYSAGKVARVIVHEATHKFADTDDVTMVDASGDDHVGYKHDGLKQNAQGYANLDDNADSYAWGGRLMWKRKRNHPAGAFDRHGTRSSRRFQPTPPHPASNDGGLT